jgi:superfamily I DNA and/or RNA helicase
MIEEAARGWMTDFFVPMVHGARWLLVGDQAQLAAHRHDEYERLLLKDISEQTTGSATGVVPVEEWRQYLRYFAHLMQVSTGRADEPRERLRVQRRMHPDIAGLISRSFYSGELEDHSATARSHGLTQNPFTATALLWLDTSSLGFDAHETRESGLQNFCEVLALKYYFRNRVPDVRAFEPEIAPLAVLSPYRAQTRLLADQLGYGEDVVHTVDSFQGREAEIVLVSLVRNNASDEPSKSLGFLTEPSRVNVMLSRARRLLVIVGNLRHFERHGGGTFWETLCTYVRSNPRFVLDIASDGFRYTKERP